MFERTVKGEWEVAGEQVLKESSTSESMAFNVM